MIDEEPQREGNTITRTDKIAAFQLAWISPHPRRPMQGQSVETG